ncbi:hypothetical protein ABEV34_23295 [Methylorubrum rhodesianum]|uniref:hypothetical protein n=1 Tax=Methylorubrum rhodesianum TaxID=29427 RepID=UPI001613BCFE|nr:hypothetical protein [Methylorubrum rhodesianum]MBB5762415.1 hypothetical protein [Methylorubrum rhodesianum]
MCTDNPHRRFAGMSYRQASEEAERLLKRALRDGAWFELPEALIVLRSIMVRRQAGHSPETDEAALS